MATYNVLGWVWSGTGSPTTLVPVAINDNDGDAQLSPYFTNDPSETITIGGTTYTSPQAGTYEITFTDSGGASHTEDLLLFYTGSVFIFVPLPGSDFDSGSVVNSLGGWQEYNSGFLWSDVVCFAGGTGILTPDGQRPVETIKMGDRIVTSDHGVQTVKWVGKKRILFSDLSPENAERLYPIRISAGALGMGLPHRDVLVSRQHRVLVTSKICTRMFGEEQVLIAAHHLTALPGIFVDRTAPAVEYFHLLFDEHEIVFAHGMPAESLLTGKMAIQTLSQEARREIYQIFPELAAGIQRPVPAAFVPKGHQQRVLVLRHARNKKPLAEQQ